jgi:hypothetical protein
MSDIGTIESMAIDMLASRGFACISLATREAAPGRSAYIA